MVAPLLSNHTHHINRIASDTGNPRLSAELQDAIRNRMAFLFVRGADGFVLKPLAEDGWGVGLGFHLASTSPLRAGQL
jgi:hypothetical protein